MKLRIYTKNLIPLLLLLVAMPSGASDEDELGSMLQEFLSAAGEKTVHESFWADDLVYTSSAGLRFGKADILAGFDASDEDAEAADAEPAIIYSGEEVDIRVYGDTAVVAFKLVGTPTDESEDTVVLYYFNTGTFLKRDGVWRVVAWQATKIPPP